MSKISDIIDTATSTYKDYSRDLVQEVKKHYVLSELLGVPISGYSNFTLRNQFYRNRLMNINIEQHNKILENFGEGSIISLGDVSDIDYNKDFANNISGDEINGNNTTRKRELGGNSYANINDLYYNTVNLYYDENDNGEFSNKLSLTNANSILDKTKRLFEKRKIDTIISRFHTEGENNINPSLGSAVSSYGMSHGRNLLKKDAEDNVSSANFDKNGYDNPYCRVWTHHYQYDNISKLIRPFTDENGTPTSIGVLQRDWSFIRGKTGADRLNKYSVLNKNGFVNITPSYNSDENSKVDTKHCMFSIENLAWKGYDPYSFEKALSWEQRGPLGGRIMWFPPYGIEFNENVNINWNSHSFIGRGENLYTYINTERSGNLSFQMLVDHPSIINYYDAKKVYYEQREESQSAWQERTGVDSPELYQYYKGKMPQLEMAGIPGVNKRKSINDYVNTAMDEGFSTKKTLIERRGGDTDLLRFFAGCDGIEGSPKNMTDEYGKTETTVEVEKGETIVTPIPKPIVDEEVPEATGSVVFYVFYPNNYSGCYDEPNNTVEAMAYLLNGALCQKHGTEDIQIKFNTLRNNADTTNGLGTGYEMTKNEGVSTYKSTYGFSEAEMCITGTTAAKKIWKYRIDGGYDEKNTTRNYYNQQLKYNANYQDKSTSEPNNDNTLNSNFKLVQSVFELDENDETIYSFAEVAYVLAESDEAKNIIKSKMVRAVGNSQTVTERLNKLEELFKNFTVTKIDALGYSNSHGNNANNNVNNRRNIELATNRAKSVTKWLKSFNKLSNVESENGFTPYVSVNTQDISSLEAKKWRSAKVKITYKISETKKLAEAQQIEMSGDTTNIQGLQEYVGYSSKYDENGNVVYEDSEGRIWSKNSDGNLVLNEAAEYTTTTGSTTRDNDFNNIRYDQEYRFFQVLKEKSPVIFKELTEKIKYFDPAFHSMTPEGFNGRLNFLHQCTRQGNTVGASDKKNRQTATNLAFGRPPICVLRLGDFYYTEIVITNMTITYDPLQWDLNSEGIGVQPLIANVNLSFNFIGGSDLAGPIKRLQNAMTFNYYANTEVYDNRADRVTYPESKMGGLDTEKEVNYEAYNTKMSK